MGVRVMTISEQVLENGTGLVTMSEIVNFIIVGGVAWVAYQRAVLAIRKKIDVQQAQCAAIACLKAPKILKIGIIGKTLRARSTPSQ